MAQIKSKHEQNWRLIRQRTTKSDTQKQRVKNWFNHFKNLLRSSTLTLMNMKKLYLFCKTLTSRQDYLIRKRMKNGKEIIGGWEEQRRRW